MNKFTRRHVTISSPEKTKPCMCCVILCRLNGILIDFLLCSLWIYQVEKNVICLRIIGGVPVIVGSLIVLGIWDLPWPSYSIFSLVCIRQICLYLLFCCSVESTVVEWSYLKSNHMKAQNVFEHFWCNKLQLILRKYRDFFENSTYTEINYPTIKILKLNWKSKQPKSVEIA